jgi:hypothetical protein
MVSTAVRPLYPRGNPGTNCTGGWVGFGDWTAQKISPPPGFNARTVQAVASRDTANTILASEYTHLYIRRSPAEIQAPTKWKLIRPQHDLSATYVIAQQHSSATFPSLQFSVSRGKIRRAFKRCYYLNFFTCLKLRKSEIA